MTKYFDYASTTPISDAVLSEMLPYFKTKYENPSALYYGGSEVEEAKDKIAKMLNIKPSEIYFTSGGSESNCWAIEGFICHCRKHGYEPVVVTSAVEHNSILECVHDQDVAHEVIGVDENGIVLYDDLEETLSRAKELYYKPIVSIQYVNNETGVIQDIKRISDICKKYRAVFHSDFVQAVPHMECDFSLVDMASISGHKFGAPKGIGILYIKDGIIISPIIYGSQNGFMRGGTYNTAFIVGIRKALEENVKISHEVRNTHCRQLCFTLFYALRKYGLDFIINGIGDSIPEICSITLLHDITANALIQTLSTAGIKLSAGSACDSHSETPSHVLTAMGISEKDAIRTIRISFSDDTSALDVAMLADEIKKGIVLIENDRTEL